MKYTHEERLEIGRRIYIGEISKYQAAAEYEINYQTAGNYMRIYRDTNHLPAKSKTPEHKPETEQTQPVITDPDLEEYESMTKEELIREIVRCKIREARLKKGYEVKGNGAEKVFIPLMLTFRAFLHIFRFDMYGDTDPHRYVTAIPARGCV